MRSDLIAASPVDLLEVRFLPDHGLHVLVITDFGHGMASDLRIIPASQVAAVVAQLADPTACAELSAKRGRFRRFRP